MPLQCLRSDCRKRVSVFFCSGFLVEIQMRREVKGFQRCLLLKFAPQRKTSGISTTNQVFQTKQKNKKKKKKKKKKKNDCMEKLRHHIGACSVVIIRTTLRAVVRLSQIARLGTAHICLFFPSILLPLHFLFKHNYLFRSRQKCNTEKKQHS